MMWNDSNKYRKFDDKISLQGETARAAPDFDR